MPATTAGSTSVQVSLRVGQPAVYESVTYQNASQAAESALNAVLGSSNQTVSSSVFGAVPVKPQSSSGSSSTGPGWTPTNTSIGGSSFDALDDGLIIGCSVLAVAVFGSAIVVKRRRDKGRVAKSPKNASDPTGSSGDCNANIDSSVGAMDNMTIIVNSAEYQDQAVRSVFLLDAIPEQDGQQEETEAESRNDRKILAPRLHLGNITKKTTYSKLAQRISKALQTSKNPLYHRILATNSKIVPEPRATQRDPAQQSHPRGNRSSSTHPAVTPLVPPCHLSITQL